MRRIGAISRRAAMAAAVLVLLSFGVGRNAHACPEGMVCQEGRSCPPEENCVPIGSAPAEEEPRTRPPKERPALRPPKERPALRPPPLIHEPPAPELVPVPLRSRPRPPSGDLESQIDRVGDLISKTRDDDDGDDPRDTPPPIIYGEEIDKSSCPQRDGNHKECVALLIDIAKNDNWRPGSLSDSKEFLEEMECDLDYVAPNFRAVPPKSYMVEKEIWSWSKMRFVKTKYWVNTSHQREAALVFNRRQMAQVFDAIDRHRAKLRAGAIMGIEMVYAHGSKGPQCGRLGPSIDWWSNSFPRKEFHQGNYDAAKGNVCIWHVVDFSCHSYRSARAVDELNNNGTTECSSQLSYGRPFHAGYEIDVAHASAQQGIGEISTNYGIAYLEDDINDVWEDEIDRRDDAGYDSTNAFTKMLPDLDTVADSAIIKTSVYVDLGYAMCVPPHMRSGPYWQGR